MGEKRKEQYLQGSSNDGKQDEATTQSRELDPFIDKDKILYSTPKNLQGRNDAPQQLGTTGNYSVIEEVTLPETYRADNIKETVKATKKLAETKQNDDGSNSEDVYLHKRFFTSGTPSSSKASDKRVVEKFLKQQ